MFWNWDSYQLKGFQTNILRKRNNNCLSLCNSPFKVVADSCHIQNSHTHRQTWMENSPGRMMRWWLNGCGFWLLCGMVVINGVSVSCCVMRWGVVDEIRTGCTDPGASQPVLDDFKYNANYRKFLFGMLWRAWPSPTRTTRRALWTFISYCFYDQRECTRLLPGKFNV